MTKKVHRSVRRMMLALLSIFLAGCSQQLGIGASVDTEVEFRFKDGKPVSKDPVYISQTFGERSRLTEVRYTDEEGRIVLSGYYCTPIMIAVDGGGVILHYENIPGSYTVTVARDRKPSARYLSGGTVPETAIGRPRACNGW
jgi:hypothetical protein